MSGLRFVVGEIAIVAVSQKPQYRGKECEIIETGFYPRGTLCADGPLPKDCQYIAIVEGGNPHGSFFADWQLRKLDPPAEPASLTRNEGCEVEA